MKRIQTLPLVASLVLALVIGAVLVFHRDDTKTVNADFDRTVGLFVGSDVRVMGMRIGRVTAIEPHGRGVKVEMTYEGKYHLPPDVKAVIVAPSVIADRFVQLTPAWTGGAELASGGTIARRDTRLPVELDRSVQVTTDLLSALGPQGANKSGALSDSIKALAGVMRGNGGSTREALRQVAAASDVIASGSGDISATIKHLNGLTGTLADYDDSVREFDDQLGSVAEMLNDDSNEFEALLKSLATSLGQVATFVADNRAALSTDVQRLAAVTSALVAERQSLTEIVDIAPLAFTDLVETYDPAAKAVRTRANFLEIVRAVDKVVCDAAAKSTGTSLAPLCSALSDLVDTLGLRNGLPGVP